MLETDHFVESEDLHGATSIPAPDIKMTGARVMYRFVVSKLHLNAINNMSSSSSKSLLYVTFRHKRSFK